MHRKSRSIVVVAIFGLLLTGYDRVGGEEGSNNGGGQISAESNHLIIDTDRSQKLENTSFAFSDEEGTRLLALESLTNPKIISKALCERNHLLQVVHLKYQEPTAQDSGRATSYNFDHHEGHIFRIVNGRTDENITCLLISDKALASRAPLEMTPIDYTKCAKIIHQRISRAKEREVSNCWIASRIDASREIVVVEFKRHGEDMLASLVFVHPNQLIFYDDPATYDEESISCWRVDDECNFSPTNWKLLGGFQLANAIELILSSNGPEGQNAMLLQSDGQAFQVVIQSYRYWAQK